jgi:hypothetical protein
MSQPSQKVSGSESRAGVLWRRQVVLSLHTGPAASVVRLRQPTPLQPVECHILKPRDREAGGTRPDRLTSVGKGARLPSPACMNQSPTTKAQAQLRGFRQDVQDGGDRAGIAQAEPCEGGVSGSTLVRPSVSTRTVDCRIGTATFARWARVMPESGRGPPRWNHPGRPTST